MCSSAGGVTGKIGIGGDVAVAAVINVFVTIVVDVVVVLFTLPVTSPVIPSIIWALSSANTEPVKLPEKSVPSIAIPVSAEPSIAGSTPVKLAASIVPSRPLISSVLSSANTDPAFVPCCITKNFLVFLNLYVHFD